MPVVGLYRLDPTIWELAVFSSHLVLCLESGQNLFHNWGLRQTYLFERSD